MVEWICIELFVIRSFRNKKPESFFRDGDRRGIRPDHVSKLGRILDRLDASVRPYDMDLPGYKLHELKGKDRGKWAVWVSGNWRVAFRFDGADAVDVDYPDCH